MRGGVSPSDFAAHHSGPQTAFQCALAPEINTKTNETLRTAATDEEQKQHHQPNRYGLGGDPQTHQFVGVFFGEGSAFSEGVNPNAKNKSCRGKADRDQEEYEAAHNVRLSPSVIGVCVW